jgi:hypothetical protein
MADIFRRNNLSQPVGNDSLGPFVVPAGSGLRISVNRAGLPAGRAQDQMLLVYKPFLSFDGGVNWTEKAQLWLLGGDIFNSHGLITTTAISWPWDKTLGGTPVVPTHIKMDRSVFVACSLDVLIETM